MKPIIIDIKDMSDSTEVYESRPNPAIIWFIYLLVIILVSAVIWMWFSPVENVVKSNGMFRSVEEPYQVSCGATGTVSKTYVSDGQFVDKGDVLYTVDVSSLGETIKYYQNQLEDIDERLTMLEAYSKSLDGDSGALNAQVNNKYYQEMLNRSKLLKANINSVSSNNATQKKNYKDIYTLTEKNSVASEMLTYQEKKQEYENYLMSYDVMNNNCSIKAGTSGYFYCGQDIRPGTYVQEGVAVGNIYPDKESGYYAEVYVDNADIAKLKTGQDVKLEIGAYPSAEHGYFVGKIESIPKDITVDQGNGNAYYVVRVDCDVVGVLGERGEASPLINGMACQAKVIVDEENVLGYVLRKLDLYD